MKINDKNLAAFSVAPTVAQREGHLLKRGEVNRAFQRRWFVLKGNLLFYFEKRGDKEPLGVIIMEGCTIELTECEEQVCSFRIIFPAREYVLAADNQELLEDWMKSLARSSYTYLKLMVAELEMQLHELNNAERRAAEEGGSLSPQEGGSGSPPTSRHRLNPFNTAEENRIFAQLWDPNAAPEQWCAGEPVPVARHRSNTVTGSTKPDGSSSVWHDDAAAATDRQDDYSNNNKSNNSSGSSGGQSNNSKFYDSSSTSNSSNNNHGNCGGGVVKVRSNQNLRQGSLFYDNDVGGGVEGVGSMPTRVAPVPPKRRKKPPSNNSSGGLKRPPNLNKIHKSDSSVSTRSSSSFKSISSSGSTTSSSSSSSSSRQYFPFAQLHLDYGAPILRDRELHRIHTGRSGFPKGGNKENHCAESVAFRRGDRARSLCGASMACDGGGERSTGAAESTSCSRPADLVERRTRCATSAPCAGDLLADQDTNARRGLNSPDTASKRQGVLLLPVASSQGSIQPTDDTPDQPQPTDFITF